MRERQREIEREKGANKSSWESERVREGAMEEMRQNDGERDSEHELFWVATICRLRKLLGLFCKRTLFL